MLSLQISNSCSQLTDLRLHTINSERIKCKLHSQQYATGMDGASNKHTRDQMFFKRLYLDHEKPVIKKTSKK